MPVYEFRCEKCGNKVEEYYGSNADYDKNKPEKCEKCDGKMVKQISNTGRPYVKL